MPAQWRIDVRLGERADSAVLRSRVVTAQDEADALRQVLAEAERDIAAAGEVSITGQEEVFAETEVALGEVEHHVSAGGYRQEPAAG
jgi:phage protein D